MTARPERGAEAYALIEKEKINVIPKFMNINSAHIKSQGTLNWNISDHLPIFAVRKKTKEIKTTTTFTCRQLKYLTLTHFKKIY